MNFSLPTRPAPPARLAGPASLMPPPARLAGPASLIPPPARLPEASEMFARPELVEAARETLRRLLEHPNPTVQLRAAVHILDRALGKPAEAAGQPPAAVVVIREGRDADRAGQL